MMRGVLDVLSGWATAKIATEDRRTWGRVLGLALLFTGLGEET